MTCATSETLILTAETKPQKTWLQKTPTRSYSIDILTFWHNFSQDRQFAENRASTKFSFNRTNFKLKPAANTTMYWYLPTQVDCPLWVKVRLVITVGFLSSFDPLSLPGSQSWIRFLRRPERRRWRPCWRRLRRSTSQSRRTTCCGCPIV